MSRQIQALEAALATPLFQRRHRMLVLTSAGQRLLLATSAALAQLAAAVNSIRAPQPATLLSLTTNPSFAAAQGKLAGDAGRPGAPHLVAGD